MTRSHQHSLLTALVALLIAVLTLQGQAMLPVSADPLLSQVQTAPRQVPVIRTRRIDFQPGASSATVKDAVVRGTRDAYLLGAGQGQRMTVKITSLEENAVFDLESPPNQAGNRQLMRQESVSWSGTLPSNGDYRIVVGSVRGNASYQLQVSIR